MTDPDTDSKAHNLGTAIRDIVIVVFSILLAFGIDAWWDSRGAVQREQALMEALVTELDAASDDLQQYRDHHAGVASAGSELIGLQGEAPVTSEKADRLLGVIIQGRPYAPSASVLDSILGAEGAAGLSDPQTALQLARWRQSTSNLAALSDTVAYYLNRDLNSYVNRHIPYRTLDLAAGSVAGIEPSAFPTEVLTHLESVEFENSVYNRYYLATRVVNRTDTVLEATREVLAVLREELQ